jgi:threonine 3-dehydrogenase
MSERRKLARKLGADAVLEEASEPAVRKLTDRGGADVLIEMSGSPRAVVEGFRCLRSGAHASLLGIPPGLVPVPLAELVIFKALTLHGINGRRMFETWYRTESFLRRHPGLVEPLITHRLPFDRFEEGIGAMQEGRACKVVLDWQKAKA